MNGQPLLTVAEVAERLRVTEITVYRKIRNGQLPAHRLAGNGRGSLRIAESELHDWLDDNRVEPQEAA
jgi:excisionase family DNA binding protein